MLFSAKWFGLLSLAIGCSLVVANTTERNREDITTLEEDSTQRQSGPAVAECDTSDCRMDAESILRSLNRTVDPCDDFYNFVCGSWITDSMRRREVSSSRIAAKVQHQLTRIIDEPINDEDPIAFKKAKKMHEVCMDTEQIESDGLQPLVDLTNEFGGWPMILEQWHGDHFDFMETIVNITRRLRMSPIISAGLHSNGVNNDAYDYILEVRKADLGVFNKLLHPDAVDEDWLNYKRFLTETVFEVMNATGGYKNDERVEEDITQIMQLEAALRKINYTADSEDTITFDALQGYTNLNRGNDTTQHNWLTLLNLFVSDVGLTIEDGSRVEVENPSYLLKLVEVLDNTPKRVVANTLQWLVIQSVMEATNEGLWNIRRKFWANTNAVERDDFYIGGSRFIRCYNPIKNNMHHVLGYKYVQEYVGLALKTTFDDIVKNVRSALNSRITQAQWLDDAAKEAFLEKANAMTQNVGFPDWYKNASALDEYYKEVTASNVYFENYINYRTMEFQRKLRNRHKLAVKPDWDFTEVFHVGARYIPLYNNINIPAATWQPPYFRLGRHTALNYGGIGSTVGYGLHYGFVPMGILSDKSGNTVQWLPESVSAAFDEKVQCIVGQYSGYRLPELEGLAEDEVTVNGLKTVNANMADNGGLSTAYLAYQQHVENHGSDPRLPGLEEYSPQQLFFIGFAMPSCESVSARKVLHQVLAGKHSPTKIRIHGSLSNSEDFAQAFGCPRGSPMNPENKCLVW